MEEQHNNFGKKVFFLNPPSVIDEVMAILAEAEYEVYTTRDHERLARYIRKDPECMVFVNIDEGDDEGLWRNWIKKLRDDELTVGVGVGVFTMLGNDDQRNTYLMDIGINAGFIVLKLGAAKTAEILLKTLEANEARGRRKYVRVQCPPDSAEFNCKVNGELSRGRIIDLSIAGMATYFQDGNAPVLHSRLIDIQLSLRGMRFLVNGIVVGAREDVDHGPFRLTMFEPSSFNEEKRRKLRSFIGKVLQTYINEKIAMS
ncbi:MAG: PilZ domain-containing protein [Spirochaetes bacterium]|nr:PilZ domain-containing protein [Spirochaetota bacterium]MBU0954507.1 PilZ domain-containing protein [Spirochaetota bacterium]